MAFHIETYHIPPLRCYNDAFLYWDRIKPWRGDPDKNTRPLAERSKRHMTIRKLNDESIAMALYGTDVVVYHKDNTITLEGYGSASTDRFAHALTPSGISTNFNSATGYLVHLNQDNHTFTYKMANRRVRLKNTDRGWFPVDAADFAPFIKYVVNVRKANAVLKEHRFNEFVTWLKATEALGLKHVYDDPNPIGLPDVMALLNEGGGGWSQLAGWFKGSTVEAVREYLYREFQCIDIIEVQAVAGYDISSIRSSHNRWGRIVNSYRGG